jgi:glycosyltransferase involved in cell wall biosynthesis
MRVLFFGTYDTRRHPRVQILMDGLRADGDTVEECNVPVGFDTDARVRMVQRPWLLVAAAYRVVACWVRLARLARRDEAYDAVVVGYLGHLDVHLARRLWPKRRIVLDYFVSLSDTAADRGIGSPPVRRALAFADRAAVRAADVVVVDTDAQRATVLARPRETTVAVPIGAPDWWFVGPSEIPPSPLRVLFFGLYTPLQGAPFIGRAIADLADDPRIVFTMVGGGQDVGIARAAGGISPNVDWRDWVEAAALPAMASEHHVCLGIFGTGPKALRVVPNKIYQGAAAGCALLTSDTAPQREMLGDAAVYVPPGHPLALAAALRALAGDPARVAALRQAAYAMADTRFRAASVVRPLRDVLAR